MSWLSAEAQENMKSFSEDPAPISKILWGISLAILLNVDQALENFSMEMRKLKKTPHELKYLSGWLTPQTLASFP